MKKNTLENTDIRLLACSFFVIIFYIFNFFNSYTPPIFFLISITAIYLSAIPKYIFHPKNILFAYYFLWYTLPVMFATRYEEFSFRSKDEVLAYCMLTSSYLIGYLVLHFSIKGVKEYRTYSLDVINAIPIKWVHYILVILSLLACFFTMALSPVGIIGWLKDPGHSFQEREGSGIATIFLIFTSGLVMTTSGYFLSKANGTKKYFLFFQYCILISIFLLCILHRQRIMQYFILMYITSLFYVKSKLGRVFLILILVFTSIFSISIVRSDGFEDGGEVAKFFLNYFDTFDALVVSIRYVEPEVLGTSFMAFNKFFVGMGFDPNMPYSISQWLTPIYFPGWGDRSTVQFPIETEMYLNGYYIGMIPVLVLYFYFVGKLYKYAFYSGSLGGIYVSLYVMLEMIGHLRGMFVDFTDFYNYPIILFSYFILNKVQESFKPKYAFQ